MKSIFLILIFGFSTTVFSASDNTLSEDEIDSLNFSSTQTRTKLNKRIRNSKKTKRQNKRKANKKNKKSKKY